VKISLGADGAATDALGGAGAVAAGVQRVTLASDDPAVAALTGTLTVDGSGVTQPVSGTITANAGTNLNTSALALESGGNLAAAATSLAAIDDWDESDRAKVNIVAGQAGVTAGAGNVAANTPRVTLAADDPGVVSLAAIEAAVEGTLTVDLGANNDVTVTGSVTANAGTNLNTSALALESGGVLDEILAALGGAPAASTFHRVAAGSGDAANIKASAGVVRGITLFNNSAVPIFVKFHNTAGAPTPGSGVVRTFAAQAGVHSIYAPPGGIAFSTGIAITIVTGIADNDTTGVTASDCVLDVEYE
jgi:hypothetical protein